ncbi:MAG TPA: DUF4908 domain-containing protein [Rhizomicrobium sp.]|jgi:hypothetical protein|nr:DUF4908 domain-containing protein [Rhizomicrobium sp.]
MRAYSQFVVSALAFAVIFAAPAQAGFFERLLGDRLASVEDGSYIAGDKIKFGIVRAGKNFLVRFDGDPETFVLSSDRTSMGARLLRYDTGETAIRVAGWGALTLYTNWQPNGLPAVRTGDVPPFAPAPVSLQDVQFIAAQDAARFATTYHLRIVFLVDWSVLETSGTLRATASAALENAARGLDQFVINKDGRKLVAKRIRRITLATGRRPLLQLQDRTLIVTFNPEEGYAGCASSRAIARELWPVLTAEKKHT